MQKQNFCMEDALARMLQKKLNYRRRFCLHSCQDTAFEGDEKTGANIILKVPKHHFAVSQKMQVWKVLLSLIVFVLRSPDGFNALTEEYVNMVDNGIPWTRLR